MSKLTNPAAAKAAMRRTLWMFALAFGGPLLAIALLMFVWRPGGKPAYGTLVDPQRPVPELHLRSLAGKPVDLRRYDGYWLMVMAAPGACGATCQTLLYDLRQFALAAGDDSYRVARVWLVTDDAVVHPGVLQPAAGTMILRADPAELAAWLPRGAGEGLEGPIWLVDPRGHLMMRFPAKPDPFQTLSVIKKLLYNTEGWKPRHLEPLA